MPLLAEVDIVHLPLRLFRYPRIPSADQRVGLVILAAMMDFEVVRGVVNTLGKRFTTALTVSFVCPSRCAFLAGTASGTVSAPETLAVTLVH